MLRPILLAVFVLLSITSQARAMTVHILQTNLQSWYTMDTRKSNPPIKNMTPYLNNGQFDFILTQENDYLLTNDIYGLRSNYHLAGTREDATIFYDTDRWTLLPDSWKSVPLTRDGGGGRVLVFAQFKNRQGEVITLATTHLCINWGKGDCANGEIKAHQADATAMGTQLQAYSGPVFLSGDFNSLADSKNQALEIETILAYYGLTAVKVAGQFIGPTFQTQTIDFVYFRRASLEKAVLYNSAQGNPSDHAAIDVTFSTN